MAASSDTQAPPADDPLVQSLLTLVIANGAGRQALTDNLTAQVAAIVWAFTRWYDDVAVRRMAKQVAALVQPTQRIIAAQEASYLSQVTSLVRDKPARPGGLLKPSQIDTLRKGIAPDEVYTRVAKQYRYEVSQGTPQDKALNHVVTRSQVMADTDVSLSARAQWEQFFTENKVTGYRRVIHPELAKGGTCGLCIAASDRVYHSSRLMPLHARCGCGVMPVIGDFDAGSSLNNLSLSDLYTAAAGDSKRRGTSAADLKRTRYAVHENGELGPVLTAKGDSFRGPADVAAA